MSPQPRIGSGRTIQEYENKKLAEKMAEQAPTLDSIGATEEERALGSVEAVIAARQEIQDASRASTPPPEPEAPAPTSTAAQIARFVSKASALQEALAAERAECAKIAEPMLSESHGIQTAMGILKQKYQAKVDEFAGVDWPALIAATPAVLVMDEKARGLVDISKQAVHRFRLAVADARSTLAGAFGDSKPDKDDTNTVSLQHATEILGSLLAGGDNHVSDKSYPDDHPVRVLSATFKRAVAQMEWWLKKARMVLEQAQRAVERFVQTERELNDVLSKIEPQDVEPRPLATTLPRLGPPPEPRATSSYTDFDPRGHDADAKPKDGAVVTPVGDNAGYRVGGR